MFDHRQRMVRIAVGISMPRKMLAYRHYAAILQPPHIGYGFSCYIFGLLPKGAMPNDGIVGIAVHIGHGSHVYMDTQHAHLTGNFKSHKVNQAVVAQSPQSHGIRKGGQVLETHRSEERRVGKECRSRWSPY